MSELDFGPSLVYVVYVSPSSSIFPLVIFPFGPHDPGRLTAAHFLLTSYLLAVAVVHSSPPLIPCRSRVPLIEDLFFPETISGIEGQRV